MKHVADIIGCFSSIFSVCSQALLRGSADGEPPVLPKAQGSMSLRDVLLRYREKIVREWVDQLHTKISDRYSKRPLDELILFFQKLWMPTFRCSSSNSVELRIRLMYLIYPPEQKGHGLCPRGWVL